MTSLRAHQQGNPQRIQRKRTKGWRMPEGTVYVGRPSRWGNPFQLGVTYMWMDRSDLGYPIATWRGPGTFYAGCVEELDDPAIAVAWFRTWYTSTMADRPWYGIADLRGHDLACWCPLDAPCHADVLLELANR